MPKRHIVQEGECLTELAQRYGLLEAADIYDHPDNAELKRIRPSPDVLEPGDAVVVPDLAMREESLPVDRNHRVRVRALKKELRIKLLDFDGSPLAGESYTFTPDRGDPVDGTTDGDGLMVELVRVGVRRAMLTIQDRVLALELGALTPARDTARDGAAGIQARLHNLGYHVGRGENVHRRRLRAAIAMFQHDHGLTLDGEVSDALVDRLLDEHGI